MGKDTTTIEANLTEPATTEACEHCRFWTLHEMYAGIRGRCRRFPPSIPSLNPGHGTFPLTAPSDVCGEFRPKT